MNNNGWFKITEKRPEENEECLICFDKPNEIFIAQYSSNKKTGYYSFESDGECWWPDMWASIPKPPTEFFQNVKTK